ncbi:unnamed protein product [Camellia sinensis]
MTSMGFTSILTKSNHAGAMALRNPWSSRIFVSVAPRPLQASFRQEARVSTQAYDKAADAAKQGANEAMNAGQDVKNKVASTAEDMTEKTKETAGTVVETAQDLTEKAKQRAGDAWDAVKDTTQKIKETVVGNGKAAAQETKQSVKQNAETVERSMNMKNE